MGDITLALRTAQSGLLGNQEALHTVSNNVANINTDGYSRKIIHFEQVTVGGIGGGTKVSEIRRNLDEGLLKTLRIENGETHTFAVQKDFYARMQDLFGAPEDDTSFAHLTTKLSEAFELLAVSPDKSLESAEVVRRANNLLKNIKGMSETIQDLRLQADKDIADLVGDMNTIISKIDQLNDDIIAYSTIGRDVTDLKDQRDIEIDKLSKLIDIRYFSRNDGDVAVLTEAGRTLVDTEPPTLAHTAASSVSPTFTHSTGDIDGIFVGAAVAHNDMTNQIREGQLKGLIDLRDSVLPSLQAELDEFASELRDVINQVHNRGSAFPGSQSMTGTRTFIRPGAQTMTLDSGDVTIMLADASGKQSAVTTLETIMTSNLYGTDGSKVQPANGPWAVSEVAAQVEDWLQANGAADATVRIGADHKMSIALNSTSLHLSFRDESATANGSAAKDAVINFDADGNGVTDETLNGFSHFFGFNDFFVDSRPDNIWESKVVSSTFSSPGSPATETLTFYDTTSGMARGTVAVTGGTSISDLAAQITNNVPNITASIVPEGDGVRLRIYHDKGESITLTQSSGAASDTLLTALGMKVGETGISQTLQIRSDIINQPAKIATGQMQWDADKGAGGEYFQAVGDDTNAQALSAAMTARNAFERAGGLAAQNATFAGYAAEILSTNASLAGDNDRDLKSQESLVKSLQFKSDSVRGVNLDEEMADLLVYEQAFAAAARIISVIQNMIDALERAVQ